MNFISVAALACTVLITGCAITHKPSDIRKGVASEYSSAKSAKTVALCVADEWEKIDNYLMKVRLRPTTNGYSVWVEQSIGTMMKDDTTFLADIDDVQSGSIVRYYTVATSKTEWKLALDKCLGDIPAKAITPQSSTSEVQTTMSNSTSQKLRELQGLRKDGVITEDEFQKKKKQLLEKL